MVPIARTKHGSLNLGDRHAVHPIAGFGENPTENGQRPMFVQPSQSSTPSSSNRLVMSSCTGAKLLLCLQHSLMPCTHIVTKKHPNCKAMHIHTMVSASMTLSEDKLVMDTRGQLGGCERALTLTDVIKYIRILQFSGAFLAHDKPLQKCSS